MQCEGLRLLSPALKMEALDQGRGRGPASGEGSSIRGRGPASGEARKSILPHNPLEFERQHVEPFSSETRPGLPRVHQDADGQLWRCSEGRGGPVREGSSGKAKQETRVPGTSQENPFVAVRPSSLLDPRVSYHPTAQAG